MIPKALKGAACGPAGALRHRVTLQQENRTPNGIGGFTSAWANVVVDLPALVTPVSGQERYFGRKLEGLISHVVLLRYRAGVTAEHRFLFGSRQLNIRAPLDLEERHEWLEVDCTEGSAV